MNIQEMHSAFRTIGQQAGIQLIRGILPETIDVYINNVITEKTHKELLTGVRTALQDSVNTQATTVSPINIFRSLYKNARISVKPIIQGDNSNGKSILNYKNNINGYQIFDIPTKNTSNTFVDKDNKDILKISPMMYLGFSVEYDENSRGNATACRLIGADVLETTLRDYCNGASKDSPIVCLISEPTGTVIESTNVQGTLTFQDQLEFYVNSLNADVKYLNIKYIKTPNVVKFDIDPTKCINCDLPDYVHYEIVERAVQKYYISIGAINTQKQQKD